MSNNNSNTVGKIAAELNEKYIKNKHIAIYLDEKFPLLSVAFPSIVKGQLTMITGSTSSGKTQLTKALAINHALDYEDKNKNVDLKIIYLALEETELEFKQKLTISLLEPMYFNEFGEHCDISYDHLNGSRKRTKHQDEGILFTDKELELIDKASAKAEEYIQRIHLITDVSSPTVMFNKCQKIAEKWAKCSYKDEIIEIEDPTTGKKIKRKERLLDYKPGSENEHVILATDHMSLLLPEIDPISGRMLSEREVINKWNGYYCRAIFCKKYGWSVFNVIQQNFDSDKISTDNYGDTIVSKTKPRLGTVGNSRESTRDAHNVLGIYNPNSFDLKNYAGYDIGKFGDTFRSIIILKARNGGANMEVPMLYDGMTQTFRELPPTSDPIIQDFYEQAKIINMRF